VIYAGIIVMWAAYFIPRWLRRHEELSESRSVEKFDQAMRILSRKETTADQRYIVMPPRPEQPLRRPSRRRRGRQARGPAGITARRRRVLAGLLLSTLVTGLLAPFTAVPWGAPLALLGVVLADLVHLRSQARRRAELARSRRAVRRRTRSRLRRFDSAERIVESRRAIVEERTAAEAARLAAQDAAEAAARAEAERLAAEAVGWAPVPVPLPTYVSKPMAARPSRPIDLTVPGAWIDAPSVPLLSEEPFDQTAGMDGSGGEPPAPALLEYGEDELDEIIERRRAVND
jgi:hypothetical protein